MHINPILPAVALALAATIGSATAAEEFASLKGLPAVAMAPTELAATRGTATNELTTAGVTSLIITHNAGPGRAAADLAVPAAVVFNFCHTPDC